MSKSKVIGSECSTSMGLTRRDSSCNFVKVGLSSSVENKKKKKNYSDTREDKLCVLNSTGCQNASIRFRIREVGPICKARKKAAQVFPNPRKDDEEDGEFAKQFGKEGWPDDDKCMWLSSGSPVSFSDGSRVDPIEEASLLLEGTSLNENGTLQEDLNEEEVVTWLVSSIGNDLTDSSGTCSASVESSCDQSLETFSSFDDSSSPFNTNSDSTSRIWDSDRTDFWVSLVNLDIDSKLDDFESDSPSSSLRSCLSSEVQFSNSSHSSNTQLCYEKSQSFASSDNALDAANFDDIDTEEPLFWPLDGKFDLGSEIKCDFFIMSPRKNNHNVGTPERTSSKSHQLKLHSKKWSLEEGCRRRLMTGSVSASSKGNKDYRRLNSTPSRLSKSTKNGMKVVLHGMEEDITESTNEMVVVEKPDGEFGSFLEDDFSSNAEVEIEKWLGLDEFDGHEGIEPEFNKDNFSLGGSL